MKLRVMSMAAAFVCAAAPTVAAAGRVVAAEPKREKIVAQDGSGDVKTIAEALASITDASATKPYRVTVKPGTYVEQVTMKPYVDLVGSGRGNTKITSSGEVGPTVLMATGTRLADVFVEKTLSWREEAPAILIGASDAVAIDGVRAEGSGDAIVCGSDRMTFIARVTITDTIAVAYRTMGILVGPLGRYDVTVDRVTASCDATIPNNYLCAGISLYHGDGLGGVRLRASNSTFRGVSAFLGYGSPGFDGTFEHGGGFAEFNDCTFEASSASAGNISVRLLDSPAVISNSRLVAVGPESYGIRISSDAAWLEINGSEISGETGAWSSPSGMALKIGASRIAGAASGVAKVVNCHDAEYNPIPNQ